MKNKYLNFFWKFIRNILLLYIIIYIIYIPIWLFLSNSPWKIIYFERDYKFINNSKRITTIDYEKENIIYSIKIWKKNYHELLESYDLKKSILPKISNIKVNTGEEDILEIKIKEFIYSSKFNRCPEQIGTQKSNNKYNINIENKFLGNYEFIPLFNYYLLDKCTITITIKL